MRGKLSIFIIVLLVLVIIGIAVFGVMMFTQKKESGVSNTLTSSDDLEKPIINLEKDIDENGTIKIIATASTNDEKGIKCIVLPDKSEVEGDEAEYTVTSNGKYTFKAKGANGTEESQIMEIIEIEQASAVNPYIPEGFKKMSDNVDEGFIIADEHGNQYVWVPVPKGKLERNTQLDTDYTESETVVSQLINSVGKYYGFYIGRFEASRQEYKGETVAASMQGKIPWTDITYTDAKNYAAASRETYGYSNDIRTSLISSYAWDTVLAWIDEKTPGYSTSSGYGNYTGTINPTGMTEKDSGDSVRQICDLAGNIKEWTTESNNESNTQSTSKDKNKKTTKEVVLYKVLRGGGGDISRTPISRSVSAENLSDQYWGFRMVLYKL